MHQLIIKNCESKNTGAALVSGAPLKYLPHYCCDTMTSFLSCNKKEMQAWTNRLKTLVK